MTILNIDKANRTTLMALMAIGLFIVFDVVAVSLNYLLSWRIEAQAVGINLAGRQRMLSQRMVKVLLQIDGARRSGEPVKAYFDELKLTFDLFDNTLRGFDVGHETQGGGGEAFFLPATTEPRARQAVGEAVLLWQDYRSRVIGLLEGGEKSDDALVQAALVEAKARNLKLLGLMNSLTSELERSTQQEAQRIRIYQIVVITLALVCFAWAFVLLRRRDAEILEIRQQASEAAYAERDYAAQQAAHATQRLQLAEDLPTLAHELFATLAPALGIGCASAYRFDADQRLLVACGHYAPGAREGDLSLPRQISLEQGLLGECAQARQMRVIVDPPESFLKIATGLMKASPRAIVLLPVVGNDRLLGMLEMALLHPLDARHEAVLNAVMPFVAMRMEIVARTQHNPPKENRYDARK